MFEVFEHTADVGIRARAPHLDGLLVEAARGLFSLIVDLQSIRPQQVIEVNLTAAAADDLVFDWLSELLYRFDAEGLLLGRFEVQVDEGPDGYRLWGRAWGEPIDRSRHALEMEVKAITYHGLRVERQADGWIAEVIVDI